MWLCDDVVVEKEDQLAGGKWHDEVACIAGIGPWGESNDGLRKGRKDLVCDGRITIRADEQLPRGGFDLSFKAGEASPQMR
jgi:hypothetical protein